jgi:hypothetical protein
MNAWGSPKAGRSTPNGVAPEGSRSGTAPGLGMGIAFAGVALIAVAVCAIILLIQRNEQRNLLARVEERDQAIEQFTSRVELAAREADDARTSRRAAEDALASYRKGAEANELRWKDERAQLEQERDNLQDELDEAKTEEERLASEAKTSLRRTDAMKLPLQAPDAACIDPTVTFKQTATVVVAGQLSQQLVNPAGKAIEAALLARKVPMAPNGFAAFVDARIHGRSLPIAAASGVCLGIEVNLMVPMVTAELDEIAWIPCKSEFDVVATQVPTEVEALVQSRLTLLVERLLERGLQGGPAGQLATAPVSQTATPNSGSTSPAQPPPTPPSPPPATPPPPPPAPGGAPPRPPKP